MAGPLLDLYGNYQREIDEFDRAANAYNQIYYSGDYANLPKVPEDPVAPRQGDTSAQYLGETLPQDLYQSVFGRSTPDVLTNEAWSLQNISTPFLNSTPSNIYDVGGVNALNNPLYYASPTLLTSGEQAYDVNTRINDQNPYY